MARIRWETTRPGTLPPTGGTPGDSATDTGDVATVVDGLPTRIPSVSVLGQSATRGTDGARHREFGLPLLRRLRLSGPGRGVVAVRPRNDRDRLARIRSRWGDWNGMFPRMH